MVGARARHLALDHVRGLRLSGLEASPGNGFASVRRVQSATSSVGGRGSLRPSSSRGTASSRGSPGTNPSPALCYTSTGRQRAALSPSSICFSSVPLGAMAVTSMAASSTSHTRTGEVSHEPRLHASGVEGEATAADKAHPVFGLPAVRSWEKIVGQPSRPGQTAQRRARRRRALLDRAEYGRAKRGRGCRRCAQRPCRS
jgi:hypothetical protein